VSATHAQPGQLSFFMRCQVPLHDILIMLLYHVVIINPRALTGIPVNDEEKELGKALGV
jgi:hypothetical protein